MYVLDLVYMLRKAGCKKENKMEKKKKNEGKKVIGVYLEEKIRKLLEISAEKNRRSISGQAAFLLEGALDKSLVKQ